MTREKKIKKMFLEFLNVYDTYSKEDFYQEYEFHEIRTLKDVIKRHLRISELNEKYGINISHNIRIVNENYIKINDNQSFSYYDDAEKEKEKGSGRYISRSDDGRQPKNEWLFGLSFSTGAYIFGGDYPEDIFKEFFAELKTYEPKYCDTTNLCLYFSMDNFINIYNDYDKILKKYREKYMKDSKKRNIERLEKEIEKLKEQD